MNLKQLKLIDFRNYKNKEFDFSKGINVVWGGNATGKTNLLEAIYLLGLGESFRARKIDEMVRFGNEWGRVSGLVEDGNGEKKLEVMVTNGEVSGKRVAKRKYVVDEASKRRKDYMGNLPVVLFRPEDLDILSSSPDKRRNFLDQVLFQVDVEYVSSFGVYNQALKRRNRILDAVREGVATKHSLTFWNGLLIKHGQVLTEKRSELVGFINHLWGRSDLFINLSIEYDKSVISERRLEQYKNEELAVGYTLVGPHKDDLTVEMMMKQNGKDEKKRDLGRYGSRGEQRMAILALKMGEIYYLEEQLSEKPILLLDDIFSELDEGHEAEVLRVMEGRQVVVTTADEKNLELFGKVKKIKLG
ncbi:DNA replication and repair protein RecF [Patescibacteria group bacterium]|nr:DNA replication and repair protein RecF [Patescibacteria group bacterium]MBU1256552.1 DNA replication and repair protein RecF [Patescibacteria group bacterium]MBU1457572.1 DNA replication and repair protein RecF [Patescibacteria group bacterium]